MKEVVIQDEIRKNPEALAAVEQATRLLEAAQTLSAPSVTAEWSAGADESGRHVLELKLSDPVVEVRKQFTLEELKNQERAQARLNWLWGDLLQVRSHKQLEKLHETIQQL